MTALLREGLRELGLDESRVETLERFAALLLKKNEVMNLTAITEPEAVAQLHLLDSAALTRFVDLSGKTVVDVGTGAGFPGMPLRILKDDFDLTLLDSLGKRIAWLEEVCGTLGLKRVECVHARAEEFAAGHRESYDLAVSRAVAQLNVLCELALPLVKVGGQFLAMKSVDTEEEIAAAKGAIRTLGGKIVKVEDYTIPTSGVTHRRGIRGRSQRSKSSRCERLTGVFYGTGHRRGVRKGRHGKNFIHRARRVGARRDGTPDAVPRLRCGSAESGPGARHE